MTKKEDLINKVYFNKYLTTKKLGEGSFGMIYQATYQDEKYALKFEHKIDSQNLLQNEAYIMSYLKGRIPFVKSFGYSGDYNILVMELLGKSLEDIFESLEVKKMSLKTVCMLGIQMITVLNYIHDKHIIHRDIKPDNFVTGLNERNKYIYLLDFGLAKKYRSSKTLEHYPLIKKKKLTGTARYASINALKGYEQSRRDDLEAVGYVLIYFLLGVLPWQGLPVKNNENRYEKIMLKKESTTPEELCKNLPDEFRIYVEYTRGLEYTQDPDYEYLKSLLNDVLDQQGACFDYIYDWLENEGNNVCKDDDRDSDNDDERYFENDYNNKVLDKNNDEDEENKNKNNKNNDNNDDDQHKNNDNKKIVNNKEIIGKRPPKARTKRTNKNTANVRKKSTLNFSRKVRVSDRDESENNNSSENNDKALVNNLVIHMEGSPEKKNEDNHNFRKKSKKFSSHNNEDENKEERTKRNIPKNKTKEKSKHRSNKSIEYDINQNNNNNKKEEKLQKKSTTKREIKNENDDYNIIEKNEKKIKSKNDSKFKESKDNNENSESENNSKNNSSNENNKEEKSSKNKKSNLKSDINPQKCNSKINMRNINMKFISSPNRNQIIDSCDDNRINSKRIYIENTNFENNDNGEKANKYKNYDNGAENNEEDNDNERNDIIDNQENNENGREIVNNNEHNNNSNNNDDNNNNNDDNQIKKDGNNNIEESRNETKNKNKLKRKKNTVENKCCIIY